MDIGVSIQKTFYVANTEKHTSLIKTTSGTQGINTPYVIVSLRLTLDAELHADAELNSVTKICATKRVIFS